METTFLTDQQIWGDDQGKGQLQVMKDYGTKTGMSDLAIVLGGPVGGSSKTSDNQLSGYVWSASSNEYDNVRSVYYNGDRIYSYPFQRLCGARPAFRLSDPSSKALAKPGASIKDANGNVIWDNVVLFGEYPQTIAFADVEKEKGADAANDLRRQLEEAYQIDQKNPLGNPKLTGKQYTFDDAGVNDFDTPFSAKKHAEYQHNGKKYIRVEAQPHNYRSVLSNGKKPQAGEACWIEVQPIEWLRDPSGICVARQALFAGVQFDRNKRYDGKFDAKGSDGKYLIAMKQYLQNYFAKEMEVGRSVGTTTALGPNTAAPDAPVVGPHTAAVADHRARQRQHALDDPSQGL